ncbi:hypothetical protein Droror1_Dr00026861 [Drosera rotundifolia]
MGQVSMRSDNAGGGEGGGGRESSSARSNERGGYDFEREKMVRTERKYWTQPQFHAKEMLALVIANNARVSSHWRTDSATHGFYSVVKTSLANPDLNLSR